MAKLFITLNIQESKCPYSSKEIPLREDDPPPEDWDGLSASPTVMVLEESLHSLIDSVDPSPMAAGSTD